MKELLATLGLLIVGPAVFLQMLYCMGHIGREFNVMALVQIVCATMVLTIAPPCQKYIYEVVRFLWGLPYIMGTLGILLHRYVLIVGGAFGIGWAIFVRTDCCLGGFWGWMYIPQVEWRGIWLVTIIVGIVLVRLHYRLYNYKIDYPQTIVKTRHKKNLLCDFPLGKCTITDWYAEAIVCDKINEYDILDCFYLHNGQLIKRKSKWPRFVINILKIDESNINDIQLLKVKLESNNMVKEISISRGDSGYDTKKICSFLIKNPNSTLPVEVTIEDYRFQEARLVSGSTLPIEVTIEDYMIKEFVANKLTPAAHRT